MNKNNVLYQVSSHRDREWYMQFQGEMNFEYALTFEKDNSTLLKMQKDMANPAYCITSNSTVLKNFFPY